jgi:hypothetical protein
MVSWADFERSAPELAATGRERLETYGFMLLGTTRRDGTARISPVEVRIVEGELVMNLVRGSMKERDVRRDPRILLHSPVLSSYDPADELKLRGRAVEIADEGLRQAVALWDPPPEFDAFSLDLEDVAFVEWEQGTMRISRWTG